MATKLIAPIETLLTKLTAAAEAVDFPPLGALTVDVFWAIAEAQPELSELVILAEREADRIRKACDDYDSVTFADSLYKVLSRAGDSCLAGSARQKRNFPKPAKI